MKLSLSLSLSLSLAAALAQANTYFGTPVPKYFRRRNGVRASLGLRWKLRECLQVKVSTRKPKAGVGGTKLSRMRETERDRERSFIDNQEVTEGR